MKKRKTMKKIIALLLTVIIVICSLPMTAFANTLESTFLESENEAVNEGNENWHLIDEQEIVTDEIIGNVSEVESLREENVKHFRLADGTYEAIVYSQPVHRKDEDGVWQDIDNTIELKTYAKASKYATRDSRVTFADRFTNNAELFTLSENGYSISMQLLSNGNEFDNEMETTDFDSFSTPIVNNISEKRTSNVFNSLEEAKSIDNCSSIVYNNIRKNTNIEYVLNGNDVKENIIVNAPCESYEYIFQITLDGLFAELSANGEIFIKDSETNDIKYIIPAPYMYDANNVYSYDVSYTLEQVKDEIYLLAVTADSEWINAEDRAFPVVVDPSINATGGIVDTYTDSAYPNNPYGSSYNLWVSNTQTTYIKLNLPELPDEAIVNTAYLYVPYHYYVSTGQLMADVYNITSNWAANTLTYNTSPILGSLISTKNLPASASITQSSPGTAMFTITAAVKNWYKGDSNYGVAIKRQNSEASTNQSVILTSSEYYPSSTYITVNYTYYIPDGVYAFQNALYDTVWMTIGGDNVWENANLKWKISNDSPASNNTFEQASLFKVARVGSTSRYTIRSMLNNNITFNIVDGEIKTKEIPSIDIDVPAEDTFSINWTRDGFTISPFSNSSYVIGIPTVSNDNISLQSSSNVSMSAQWWLDEYTGPQQHGFGLYASNYPLAIGNSGVFKVAVWSTEIGYNTPNLSVHESSTDRLIIDWYNIAKRGAFELLKSGTATVTIEICNNLGISIYSNNHFIQIIPIKPDTYYIQNAQTQKYITSDYYDSAQSLSSQNISAGQWTYDNANYQRWGIEYTDYSYQYVTIRSSEYSGGYLGVDQNDSTKTKQYATVNDYCTWKIEITNRGNFKFTCKALENNDQELVLAFGSHENGARLIQAEYQYNDANDIYCYDEWHLRKNGGYTINVSILYDNAYNNRYSNAYSRIGNQILTLQNKYMQEFGINVNCSYIMQFDSYADTYCTTNYIEKCNHTYEPCRDSVLDSNGLKLYSLHHTNINNIMWRIPFPDISSTVKVAYIGHELCTETNHTDYPYYGLAWAGIGLATITNFSSESSETKTFIHEFNHFYGVEDHYGGSAKTTLEIIAATGNTGYSSNCIHGENKGTLSVINDLTICDGCKTTIRNNISKFNH